MQKDRTFRTKLIVIALATLMLGSGLGILASYNPQSTSHSSTYNAVPSVTIQHGKIVRMLNNSSSPYVTVAYLNWTTLHSNLTPYIETNTYLPMYFNISLTPSTSNSTFDGFFEFDNNNTVTSFWIEPDGTIVYYDTNGVGGIDVVSLTKGEHYYFNYTINETSFVEHLTPAQPLAGIEQTNNILGIGGGSNWKPSLLINDYPIVVNQTEGQFFAATVEIPPLTVSPIKATTIGYNVSSSSYNEPYNENISGAYYSDVNTVNPNNYTVSLSNTSYYSYSYEWNLTMPNGSYKTSNRSYIDYTYLASGSYTLHLKIPYGDNGSVIYHNITITVNPQPTASITISPTSGNINTVTFTLKATRTGGTGPYGLWYTDWGGASGGVNFGNSTTASTSYVFSTAKNYTVTASYADGLGQNVISNQVILNVNNYYNMIASSQNPTDVNNTITFTASVFNGTTPYTYAWYVDGSLQSNTTASFSYKFTTAGTYTIESVVNDSNGVKTYDNYTETVNSDPTVTIVPAYTNIDPNYTDSFTASVSGGTSPYTYAWFVDGNQETGSSSTFSYDFTATGTYTVSVEITDALGYTARTSKTITVSSISIAETQSKTSQEIYDPVSFSITASGGSGSGYSYLWSNGNTTATSVYSFDTAGTHYVYVNVTDALGYTKEGIYSVYIYPIGISLKFTNITSVILNGKTITLNDGYYNFTTTSRTYVLNETSDGYYPTLSKEHNNNEFVRTLTYTANKTFTIYEDKAYSVGFYASGYDAPYSVSLNGFTVNMTSATSYAYFNASFSGTATITGTDFLFTSLSVNTGNLYNLTVLDSNSPTFTITTNAFIYSITDSSPYGAQTFSGLTGSFTFTGYYGYNNTITITSDGFKSATKSYVLTSDTAVSFQLSSIPAIMNFYFEYNGTSSVLAKTPLKIDMGGAMFTANFTNVSGVMEADLVLNISVGNYNYNILTPTTMQGFSFNIPTSGTFNIRTLTTETYYLTALTLRNVIFYTNMPNSVSFQIESSNGQLQTYSLTNGSLIQLPIGNYILLPSKISGYLANPSTMTIGNNTLAFSLNYVKQTNVETGLNGFFTPYYNIFAIIISIVVGLLLVWKMGSTVGFFASDIVLLLFYMIHWATVATLVIYVMFSLAVIVYGLFLKGGET